MSKEAYNIRLKLYIFMDFLYMYVSVLIASFIPFYSLGLKLFFVTITAIFGILLTTQSYQFLKR